MLLRKVREARAYLAEADATLTCRDLQMEDVSFHQCVKLGKFDSDRAVTFIPPGEDVLVCEHPLRPADCLHLSSLKEDSVSDCNKGFNVVRKCSLPHSLLLL